MSALLFLVSLGPLKYNAKVRGRGGGEESLKNLSHRDYLACFEMEKIISLAEA